MRYEQVCDACGFGNVRSCCDNSVRGNGDGMPPAVAIARDDRARAANAVRNQVWLMAVSAMMEDEGDPDECRARLFGGSREQSERDARRAVGQVAFDLAEYYGA